MSDRPLPHVEKEWHPTLAEDYSRAQNDDERRAMLLRFGYDEAHRAEALRLFPDEFNEHQQSDTACEYQTQPQIKNSFADFLSKLVKKAWAIIAVLATVFSFIGGWEYISRFLRWLKSLFFN